jgi:hypothetical protein
MVRRTPDDARPGAPERGPLVSWKVRVAELGERLLESVRTHGGADLAARLSACEPAEAQRLLEGAACTPGALADGRSALRAFAEESTDLEPLEREQLLRWERERRRGVYLVERCFPDVIEAWDPVAAERLVIHLPERLPGARASEVRRGTVVVAVTVPWTTRLLARGQVELWNDPAALALYRTTVRDSGRAWHDLPPPAPTPR